MRFFTRVACFAIHHCRPGLLLTTQLVAGKSLVAADLLVAAARSRHPHMMWDMTASFLAEDLNDPICVGKVLPDIAASDHLPAFRQLMEAAQRLEIQPDTDDLLVRIVRHGAGTCWDHAVGELKLAPTPKAYEALTDAAIDGGNVRIQDHLRDAAYLPEEFRTRLYWKRELDTAVRGRNPNYIREVVANARWLKPEDFTGAERFALRKRYDYLKQHVINNAIDMAIGQWAQYRTLHGTPPALATGVPAPELKHAA